MGAATVFTRRITHSQIHSEEIKSARLSWHGEYLAIAGADRVILVVSLIGQRREVVKVVIFKISIRWLPATVVSFIVSRPRVGCSICNGLLHGSSSPGLLQIRHPHQRQENGIPYKCNNRHVSGLWNVAATAYSSMTPVMTRPIEVNVPI